MTHPVPHQQYLMKLALRCLADIETVHRLFGGIDDKYCREEVVRLEQEYDSIMNQLKKLL